MTMEQIQQGVCDAYVEGLVEDADGGLKRALLT